MRRPSDLKIKMLENYDFGYIYNYIFSHIIACVSQIKTHHARYNEMIQSTDSVSLLCRRIKHQFLPVQQNT